MAQAVDDEKDLQNPWVEVFQALGGKTNVNQKVETVTNWGLEIMDMLQADKQDRDALCESLNIDGSGARKFQKAVEKCLIKYSEWSFLKGTLSEEKQEDKLIQKLNMVEKPSSMITDDDLKGLCEECEVNVGDVRNVIGWYKTLQPLIAQTKDTITAAVVKEKIRKLYNEYDLPFFAMEEADDDDIKQLAGDLGFDEGQTRYFMINVASQLKLQGLMTQIAG